VIFCMPVSNPDNVRDRLSGYENALDEIDVLISTGKTSMIRPGRVFLEKNALPAIIDSLENNQLREKYVARFECATCRLDILERLHGHLLVDNMLRELQELVNRWHAALCHQNLGNLRAQEFTDLVEKDLIAALIEELRGRSDIAQIERSITSLEKECSAIHYAGEISENTCTRDYVDASLQVCRHHKIIERN